MVRIMSRPVRRSVTGLTRSVQIGEVTAWAEMKYTGEELKVRYAIFHLPGGGVGAVTRVDIGGSERWWAAGARGGWLPDTYGRIQDALQAACAPRWEPAGPSGHPASPPAAPAGPTTPLAAAPAVARARAAVAAVAPVIRGTARPRTP